METTSQVTTTQVRLADGIFAEIEIRRVGQCPIAESDMICVRATVRLPTEDIKIGKILEAIRFEDRLEICNEGLAQWWGGCSAPGRQTREKYADFIAPKWTDAESAAMGWAALNVDRLAAALKARAEALASA